jgi:transcription elongation GreA/GreB family factor
MTQSAWQRLVDECARLREDLSTLTGQGLEEGIVRLPVARASRRLATLTDVLDRSDIVRDPGCGAIGRRAVLRDGSGETLTYRIVCPGDGDPASGLVSADSPLGASLMGAQAGETISVDAPSGPWRAVVVAVD